MPTNEALFGQYEVSADDQGVSLNCKRCPAEVEGWFTRDVQYGIGDYPTLSDLLAVAAQHESEAH